MPGITEHLHDARQCVLVVVEDEDSICQFHTRAEAPVIYTDWSGRVSNPMPRDIPENTGFRDK
jgi:hypothetical protein